MQHLFVIAILLGAILYLIKYVYQLFFSEQAGCKGCGLTPKSSNETKSKSTGLSV